MFTGIIESLGEILQVDKQEGSFFEISFAKAAEMDIGDSIAVNGVCLSVLAVDSKQAKPLFRCFATAETLALSNLQYLQKGSVVNLERALNFGAVTALGGNSRLNGHYVMGHVDGCEELLEIQKHEQSHIFRISLGQHIQGARRYLIQKGSICLNGISLTIYSLDAKSFSVMIIPHSFQHTNLHTLKPGQLLNIEFDMIAKYVENFQFFAAASEHPSAK